MLLPPVPGTAWRGPAPADNSLAASKRIPAINRRNAGCTAPGSCGCWLPVAMVRDAPASPMLAQSARRHCLLVRRSAIQVVTIFIHLSSSLVSVQKRSCGVGVRPSRQQQEAKDLVLCSAPQRRPHGVNGRTTSWSELINKIQASNWSLWAPACRMAP